MCAKDSAPAVVGTTLSERAVGARKGRDNSFAVVARLSAVVLVRVDVVSEEVETEVLSTRTVDIRSTYREPSPQLNSVMSKLRNILKPPSSDAARYASATFSGCQESGPMLSAKPSIPPALASRISAFQESRLYGYVLPTIW